MARCWKAVAALGRRRGVGHCVGVLRHPNHPDGLVKAAPAGPGDAPCPPRRSWTLPGAGRFPRWTAPRPTTPASERSFPRPTPSRGSPDGATTRYGILVKAAVNRTMPKGHKNLWKTYPGTTTPSRRARSLGRGVLPLRGIGLSGGAGDRAGRPFGICLHRDIILVV